MGLTLTLKPAYGTAVAETRTLTQGTLSIGRAPGNNWVLPDPDRLLSKTHCVIVSAGGRCLLTDLSTNGVFVNGGHDRVPRDSQIELTDGDEFRLGGYVIRVEESSGATLIAGQSPLAQAPSGDPFGAPDPLSGDAFDDPFDHADAKGFSHPIAAPPAALRTHDPFDLADEQLGGARGANEDLFKGATPLDSWEGPAQADHADAPLHAFNAPKPLPTSNFEDLDIDALLGDEPPGGFGAAPGAAPGGGLGGISGDPFGAPSPPPAAAPAKAPPPAAEASPFAEPDLPPRPAPAPPPPRAPRPQGQGQAGGDLLAAFLQGAGLPDLVVGDDPEAVMREAGAIFRAMVEGIRQVLISRATIKNEFRVEKTMLRANDNNALKFCITDEEALAALLQPNRPGYKNALDATREAFDDVRSHEMAVMAGMQTALMGLLRRFRPDTLESRLQEPGLFASLVPGARKARIWELFCATYGQIAREAEDDFQSVFGQEFARAYDEQMQKL